MPARYTSNLFGGVGICFYLGTYCFFHMLFHETYVYKDNEKSAKKIAVIQEFSRFDFCLTASDVILRNVQFKLL